MPATLPDPEALASALQRHRVLGQLEEQVTRLVVKSESRLSEEQKKVIKRDIQEKKQALRDLQDDFGSTTSRLAPVRYRQRWKHRSGAGADAV